ncbi:hypothetical protein OG883_09645 [Streptomyces sp. NBC_01142]|uniref:hypothetical protein n=1 Tax=Streptomyces sp. NBC_01142 TaxID=2975865 RepID=UPI00224DCABB|nr:hypothetical protein [Streptomyces sp. NBC_01142]MCX4820164.1 hypothetical protein [Streptomyces sp. NBC_01142]
MEQRETRCVPGRDAGRAEPPGSPSADHGRSGERQAAIRCAALLLAMLLLIDVGSGGLTTVRAVLWTGLAVLLFVVLLPPRVTAGEGWLASRGLLRERTVRTDRLVSVRWSDGVAQRLVLRDLDGGRVELDPRVLVANPRLWRLLDAGARTSLGRGTLLYGAAALRQLSRRIDGETVRSVFTVSGLE